MDGAAARVRANASPGAVTSSWRRRSSTRSRGGSSTRSASTRRWSSSRPPPRWAPTVRRGASPRRSRARATRSRRSCVACSTVTRSRSDYEDAGGDAARIAARSWRRWASLQIRALELARAVFFRGKGAYLVGRLHTDGAATAAACSRCRTRRARRRGGRGARCPRTRSASCSASRARTSSSEPARPREMVDFLRLDHAAQAAVPSCTPRSGYNKHGKTELYRSLLRHLDTTDDRFEIAPGQRGMVMSVFTLPGFDVVFKVIRDRFDFPKTVTHDEVREKYRLVFRHDRAGRLVDAQEFEHLEFDARALRRPTCSRSCRDSRPRRSTRAGRHGGHPPPLHRAPAAAARPLPARGRAARGARRGAWTTGRCCATWRPPNIFPGDMLLKNFGVSRHGRLIFYDYDELCLLSECRFRELPRSPRRRRGASPRSLGSTWASAISSPRSSDSFLGLARRVAAACSSPITRSCSAWTFWHRMQERAPARRDPRHLSLPCFAPVAPRRGESGCDPRPEHRARSRRHERHARRSHRPRQTAA